MTSWSPTINPNSFFENWSTISLSLRDLRRNVPLNYNQYTGVILTPACFSDKKYTDDKATCVADLIAIGYRRFVVDLYLNSSNGAWDICPATFPAKSQAAIPSSSEPLPLGSTTVSAPSETPAAALHIPQASTSSSASTADLADPITLGQYTCDDSFNATALLSIFNSWMTGTDTDLGARILLLDFNLHGTLPTSNSSNPSAEPLFQTLNDANILADAYTPDDLLADRANLNNSWFGDRTNTNSSAYFTTQDRGKVKSTDDGWPSEAYLEFIIGKRVLVSFGTIEAGLSYDPAATGDESNIFPSGYLGKPVIFNSSSSPKCFFSASNTELKGVNSSWAEVVDTTSDPFPRKDPGPVTDLVKCGYSTLLKPGNSTNLTGTEKIVYYIDHIKASVAWAWDVNEPLNTIGKEDTFRCASMSAKDGRWMVSDCGERKLAACRIQGMPYNWRLASRDGTYYDSTDTCSEGSDPATFDAPRTALENQYLLDAIQKADIPQDHHIWLDLNSLAVGPCWVTGGANASCPYEPTDFRNREVIVSAVAAVIVLIVFGLMWFAKVGGWRVERSRKKRRKMLKKRNLEGVEYEGVPS